MVNIAFAFIASLCLFLPLLREEKEDQTLGLILMTGISPFAYVLGKFGSRLLTFGKLLSIQIPFVVLSVTFGGVTLETVLVSYLLVFSYLFFISALCFFVSMIATSILSGVVIVIFLTHIFQYLIYLSKSSNYKFLALQEFVWDF